MRKLPLLTGLALAAWVFFIFYSITVLFRYNYSPSSSELKSGDPTSEDDVIISKDVPQAKDKNIYKRHDLKRLKALESKFRRIAEENERLKTENHRLKQSISIRQSSLTATIPLSVSVDNDPHKRDTSYLDRPDGDHHKLCPNFGHKSFEHEEARRTLHVGINEFWYNVKTRFEHMSRSQPEATINKHMSSLKEQFRSLMSDSLYLAQTNDAVAYRRKELNRLGQVIQRRIMALQNPSDCKNAPKLVCSLNKGCGFGCQMHHAVYCFIVAYSLNRTLILDTKHWSYSAKGWTSVFRPLSDQASCSLIDDRPKVDWGQGSAWWTSSGDANKEPFGSHIDKSHVIFMPIVDSLNPRPRQLPLAFPREFADELLKLHGNPSAWWIGQFLSYLWRPQPDLRHNLDDSAKAMQLSSAHASSPVPDIPQNGNPVDSSENAALYQLGPVVGVHVRRTDKVGSEAAFHSLAEYMGLVDDWFDLQDTLRVKYANKSGNVRAGQSVTKKFLRRVYLATDDPGVIEQAQKTYTRSKGYEILADRTSADTAQMSSRYSDPSLLGIIRDTHFLAKCSYLVCTFSSQVCRMAYELMQVEFEPLIAPELDADHAEDFRSLDDVFYFGGQSAHEQVAIFDHRPSASGGEIELKIGDVIRLAGNHWNGFSKGTNERTGEVGLYPSYKVKELWRIENFPLWNRSDA